MSQPHPSAPSPQAGDRLELEIQGVMVAFRYCPPGRFLMGSPEDEADRDDDETQHEVTLTRGFWLGETQVTQRLWKAVNDGQNPSKFQGLNARPVENVTWFDCEEFIEKLHCLGVAPSGLNFDFPTEAEWEYACRAGTTTPFNFGSQLNGDKANCDGYLPYGTSYKGAYIGETVPVRSYPPNAWGLYEMHGNVREWCKDFYGFYPSQSLTDLSGSSFVFWRVVRGGYFGSDAKLCRSANRGRTTPGGRGFHTGFRLALRSAE